LAYDGRQWVAVGHGAAFTSPDGSSWTARHVGECCRVFLDVAAGDGGWIAVGQGGAILASPDGIHWTPRTSPTTAYLSGVAHRAGQWIAVGQAGTILTSPDGVAWTKQATTGGSLNAVAWGDGQWVVVGERVWGALPTPSIFTSPDGITWTPRATHVNPTLRDVVFDPVGPGPRWVAVGTAGSWTSQDGITWTQGLPTPEPLGDVASKGGTWVAVWGRTVWTSTDGSGWTRGALPTYGAALAAARPAALHCRPDAQEVDARAPATVMAGGGVWPYHWSAPGAATAAGQDTSTFTVTYRVAGLHAVTVTDAAGASATCTVAVRPPPPAVHVHGIDFVRTGQALHGDVSIADELEAPSFNATVQAELCGPSGTCVARDGVTDAAGRARFTFPANGGSGTYTLCVTDIVADRPWDQDADHAVAGRCESITLP
jgi:hypothetical protein